MEVIMRGDVSATEERFNSVKRDFVTVGSLVKLEDVFDLQTFSVI